MKKKFELEVTSENLSCVICKWNLYTIPTYELDF